MTRTCFFLAILVHVKKNKKTIQVIITSCMLDSLGYSALINILSPFLTTWQPDPNQIYWLLNILHKCTNILVRISDNLSNTLPSKSDIIQIYQAWSSHMRNCHRFCWDYKIKQILQHINLHCAWPLSFLIQDQLFVSVSSSLSSPSSLQSNKIPAHISRRRGLFLRSEYLSIFSLRKKQTMFSVRLRASVRRSKILA